MEPDLWKLYEWMYRSRQWEQVVAALWEEGLISGEMHLGTGEEAIIAGVISHLENGDSLALDHRGTAAMLMRGVSPQALLREYLGWPDGLCAGMGGHMHLFSPQHLAASSGIVGAAGPIGAGFALAAQHLRPGAVAVALFGEGATNQGMLLESLNLAVVWKLPVLFVCKDDRWSITTPSHSVIGGSLVGRAASFGMQAVEIDGTDVLAVWRAAQRALQRARDGEGPSFLHAHCVHLHGHFLGDPILRSARHPLRELRPMVRPLLRAVAQPGGIPFRHRLRTLRKVLQRLQESQHDRTEAEPDPVAKTRALLLSDQARLEALEQSVIAEIHHLLDELLADMPEGNQPCEP